MSGCPHGSGPPSSCSQCLGVPARRVSDDGSTIDGIDHGQRPIPSASGHGAMPRTKPAHKRRK